MYKSIVMIFYCYINVIVRVSMVDPGISKLGGGCGPSAVEFLGLGFVLMPLDSHITYVFVARIVNKIHIVNILY